jgi:hypothetical protein
MDKPTNPPRSNPPNSIWPEDSGSGQSFGATGIFGTVNEPEPAKIIANPGAEPDPLAKWLGEPQKPQAATPPPTTKDFAEPVVHKVVFGGGAAESSPQLLDRMRQASAERPAVERPQEPGNKGSGGFTELLRTLSSEPASPPVAPAPPAPAQDAGVTSLLRTLGTPEPAGEVHRPAPAPGGFTELLRATSADAPEFSSAKAQSPAWREPIPSGAAPSESKPGAFTQMFGAFSGESSSAPPEAAGKPQSSPGTFTKMLSIEQQTAPAPAFQEVRAPLPGAVDYGHAHRVESPVPGRDPFASAPLPEPPQNSPGGSGMGITRLIQMLDEPASSPAPQIEPAPMRTPSAPEPGEWTKTFASLSQSNETPAPAKASGWTPAQPTYSAAPPVVEPVQGKPAMAGGASEFTRILDASRIRELSMKGGAAGSPAPSASPQSFTPAAPPMPNFQMPASPPMQMPGGMPQPPAFAAPQAPPVPGFPMSYGPPAGGMPQMGGMPQAPGMQMPSMPSPPVSQVPSVMSPNGGAGKTQQLLVIMGVVIIVLLVAILVTVIFLMKH